MTERPLDGDAEQERTEEKRALEWIDDDAKITHAEDGEMGEERKRCSAPMGWLGWAAFLCHEVAFVGIHLLRFLLPFLFFFAPDWKFFLRISLFHPPSPLAPSGLHPSFFPFSSISKWKANSVTLREPGSFPRHFSPDRVPRRGDGTRTLPSP